MSQNLTNLASQGRAYSPARVWSEEELELLLAIESSGKGVPRLAAAEYIRNGITSMEEYEKAVKEGFVPKSLETLQNEAVAEHVKQIRENLGFESNDEESEDDKKAREALEAEAKELGINVTANMKDETIAKKIADKKAAS